MLQICLVRIYKLTTNIVLRRNFNEPYVSAPGQSFGELALLGDDGYGRRNASVIADDDSDLLVIERDLFEETLKVRLGLADYVMFRKDRM